jgi:hypothetical protein
MASAHRNVMTGDGVTEDQRPEEEIPGPLPDDKPHEPEFDPTAQGFSLGYGKKKSHDTPKNPCSHSRIPAHALHHWRHEKEGATTDRHDSPPHVFSGVSAAISHRFRNQMRASI